MLVRDSHSLDRHGKPVSHVVVGMVNRATVALTDEPSVPKAFSDVLAVTGLVLIKLAPGVREAILEPLVRGILTSGVAASKVVLYRKPRRNEHGAPVDLAAFASRYGLRIAEPVYSRGAESLGGLECHLADVFYECDSIVNVTLLADCAPSHLGPCLLSHLESVREVDRFRRTRANAILALNALAVIKDKTRLVVLDALQPIVGGGTGGSSQVWPFGAVVMARDPVALDVVGWSIIGRCRAHLGLELDLPGSSPALAAASRLGLGNSKRGSIDLVQIDV